MQLVVILERTSTDPLILNYVLRASVPLARQPYYADATFVSAYVETPQADLDALRAGQYIELARQGNFSGLNQVAIKARLVDEQAVHQADTTADGVLNPYKFYGSSWDGATWTMTGVS